MVEKEHTLRQLSVFLLNRPGALAEVARCLADHNINLRAFTLSETREFGTMRIIVDDADKAVEVLTKAGHHFNEVDVLGVEVPDRPGGMAEVVEKLTAEQINVEYAYTMVITLRKKALTILRVDDLYKAVTILKNDGRHLLTEKELKAL